MSASSPPSWAVGSAVPSTSTPIPPPPPSPPPPHAAIAAMASRVVGRPVKLVLSRSQVFLSVGNRPATRQRLRLGADAQGKLTALIHETANETSRDAIYGEPGSRSSHATYAVANYRAENSIAELDIPPPGWMRAPGEAPGSFAVESALDELAAKAGIDPLALRLLHHAHSQARHGPAGAAAAHPCRFHPPQRQARVEPQAQGGLRRGRRGDRLVAPFGRASEPPRGAPVGGSRHGHRLLSHPAVPLGGPGGRLPRWARVRREPRRRHRSGHLYRHGDRRGRGAGGVSLSRRGPARGYAPSPRGHGRWLHVVPIAGGRRPRRRRRVARGVARPRSKDEGFPPQGKGARGARCP